MIRLTGMLRILYFSLAALPIAFGQKGLADPEFDKVPFAQWLKGGDDAHIRCSLSISPEHLTPQQRMGVRISARVAGKEFVKRGKAGEVVVFLEIRYQDGRVFQTHRDITLPDKTNVNDLAYASFDQSALISPGNYEVAAAVYDTESKEHSLKHSKLRIRGPAHDPLPESWRTVPAVEFRISQALLPEGTRQGSEGEIQNSQHPGQTNHSETQARRRILLEVNTLFGGRRFHPGFTHGAADE